MVPCENNVVLTRPSIAFSDRVAMIVPPLRLSLADERSDALDEGCRLLEVREVAGAGDRLEPRDGNRASVRVAVVGGSDESIVGTPQEHGRQRDPVQPLLELRIVEVRLPGVQRRGLAIAHDERELIVRKSAVVDGWPRRIAVLQA